MVSYLTTLFLGKPLRDNLPVLSAHLLLVTDNLLFLNERKREMFFSSKKGRPQDHYLQSGHGYDQCPMALCYFY